MQLIRAGLLALLVTPAVAQEKISPQAFLDRVEGRTATFDIFPDGNLVGVEQFLSRTRTVWARSDGSCAYGDVSIQGDAVCFLYEDDPGNPHCWVPFARASRIFVLNIDGSEIQMISRLTKKPVSCVDAPLS